jgi:hypothetical protein
MEGAKERKVKSPWGHPSFLLLQKKRFSTETIAKSTPATDAAKENKRITA